MPHVTPASNCNHSEPSTRLLVTLGFILTVITFSAICIRLNEKSEQADEWRQAATNIVRTFESEGRLKKDINISTMTPEEFREAIAPLPQYSARH